MKNRTIENMLENKKPCMATNLQFFAKDGQGNNDNPDDEPDDDDDDDDSDEPDDGDNDDSDKDSKSGKGSKGKTFTQEEMTANATKEKKQGRRAAFREMGFKSEKEAKDQLEAFRQWQQSQLTPEQKQQAELDQAKGDKTEAEKRAEAAENKLAAIEAGVKKDAVDDAVAIAMLKVTEDKSLDDVLAEMKTQSKYKSFFEDSDSDDDSGEKGGTGSGVKHKSNPNNKNGIGKRLAEQQNNLGTKKSSFFRS